MSQMDYDIDRDFGKNGAGRNSEREYHLIDKSDYDFFRERSGNFENRLGELSRNSLTDINIWKDNTSLKDKSNNKDSSFGELASSKEVYKPSKRNSGFVLSPSLFRSPEEMEKIDPPIVQLKLKELKSETNTGRVFEFTFKVVGAVAGKLFKIPKGDMILGGLGGKLGSKIGDSIENVLRGNHTDVKSNISPQLSPSPSPSSISLEGEKRHLL
mgnify:CR=1 FL=1